MYCISDYSELYCSLDTTEKIRKPLCLIKNGVINKMYVGVEVKRYAFMALVPSWRARLLTMRKETDEARR
jgi:hypothetical protein